MLADRGPLVLAVDLGTSALKAGLCAVDGSCAGSATVALSPVHGLPDGLAESDAAEWAPALRKAAESLVAGGAGGRVRAVVVSGHGPSLVATDRSGRPLRPAMLWLDRRAAAEAEELSLLWGRRVESWYFLPKALWLARHEPAVYEASAYLMSAPEHLALTLTGVARTVLHTEAFRHYYWSDDVVRRAGLGLERFPPFVASGEVTGSLLSAAAGELGLPAGIPVVAGGPDFLMSLVGTGTVAPGRGCDRAGSSEGINVCAAREVRDTRLRCHPHIIAPYWNISGMIPASGLAVAWVRSVVGASRDPYESFFDGLATVPPGARGLLFVPFSAAGGGAAFAGLGLHHGRLEMGRAVVESVAFEIRDLVLSMRENGLPVESLTVTGGQARLGAWSQIKADVCGLEVRVPRVTDAELVGGAAMGFVSLREYATLAEAAEQMVRIERRFTPQPGVEALYAKLHGRYRQGISCLAAGRPVGTA